MALIKLGALAVQISGSIAGIVFARNKGGAYVRAKTVPINPNTALQQRARAAMAMLTEYWKETLTGVERTAWNLYASSVNMLNRLGETIKHSGMNHFIRSNAFLAQYGMTIIEAGPVNFTVADQDPTISIAASEATQRFTVTFDDGLAWCSEDNAYLTALSGQPQNATRDFFNGPWKGIRYLSGNSGAPLASPLELVPLHVITEGQRVWVQFRIYRADGRVSTPFEANCIVAA